MAHNPSPFLDAFIRSATKSQKPAARGSSPRPSAESQAPPQSMRDDVAVAFALSVPLFVPAAAIAIPEPEDDVRSLSHRDKSVNCDVTLAVTRHSSECVNASVTCVSRRCDGTAIAPALIDAELAEIGRFLAEEIKTPWQPRRRLLRRSSAEIQAAAAAAPAPVLDLGMIERGRLIAIEIGKRAAR